MNNSHRINVLVTSCLKTPVDPHTKIPVALYERERTVQRLLDDKDHEEGIRHDSRTDVRSNRDSPPIGDYRAMGDDSELHRFRFSNEEYYRKLARLKEAHLYTMAQLERMLHVNLQLRRVAATGRDHKIQWGVPSLMLAGQLKKAHSAHGQLKKAHSAHELRRNPTDETCESDREHGDYGDFSVKKGLLNFAKKHIRNMWRDFSVGTQQRNPSLDSPPSPTDNRRVTLQPKVKVKGRGRKVTVPKPFAMTLREAERKREGVRSRSAMEWENAKLRRQLEELTECQRQFRAGPAPAHVHLPLFQELQEEQQRRRRRRHLQATENPRLCGTQRPFGFLERERARAEQKEAQLREQVLLHAREEEERRRRPFRAKPVPRAVREAALGEEQKEAELYRAIRVQMRARELLQSASLPRSTLAGRLSDRRTQKADGQPEAARHQPRLYGDMPDFDSRHRRFQRQLARRRDVRPVTACEPFHLRTANIASHKQRIMADIEAERRNPRPSRWPFVATVAMAPRSPNAYSTCSSLSGSQDYLPAKITDTAKKRQEAVRKVLEQRRKAEEEEESWREKQQKRERRLQEAICKRAKAYDPRGTQAQGRQVKLQEFRKQTLQQHREYQEEMREMKRRVRRRPLLLEQVAQENAKQAAARRFAKALRGRGLSEAFISSTASIGRKQPASSSGSSPEISTPKHSISPDYSLPNEDPVDYDDYQQDITGDAQAKGEREEGQDGNDDIESGSDREGEDLHT